MTMNKRSKKNTTEKLRKILDDPNDPEIRKSVSKDDRSLDSIRKRLSGESTTPDSTQRLSDLFVAKSDSLQPKVKIHKKEKTSLSEVKESRKSVEHVEVSKKEPIEEDIIEAEDLYEVEKVDTLEPEFMQVRPKKIIKKEEKKQEKPEGFSLIEEPIKKEIAEESGEDLPEWRPIDELEFIQIIDNDEVEKKGEEISEEKTLEDEEIKSKIPVPEEEKVQTREPMRTKEDDIKEIDATYITSKKIKREDQGEKKVRIYRPLVVLEMWAFTIIIGGLAFSGLFLLRDWIFLNFGVYGSVYIPTPKGTQDIHILFGFAFAILGLIHVAIHIFSKKKDILPVQTLRDFKAFLHSGLYLVGFARREDYGTSARFNGRQRIIYLALVYILGLTLLTGFLYYLGFLTSNITMVHVIPAGLSIMVLLFQFLITIRKHDSIALKGAFLTGKIPLWYVRKNQPIWYEQLKLEKEISTSKVLPDVSYHTDEKLIKGGDELTNAVSKFVYLLDETAEDNAIEAITEELRANIDADTQSRIIELSTELGDETEDEIQEQEEKATSSEEEPVKDKEDKETEESSEKKIKEEQKPEPTTIEEKPETDEQQESDLNSQQEEKK